MTRDATRLFPGGLPVLDTPRLTLRGFRDGDLEDVFAYASDPEATRFVRFATHRGRDETARWLRRIQAPGPGAPWALELKATGRVVGSLGARDWEPEHRCCEVGFVLARPHWGAGLASEALRAAVDAIFAGTAANRIQAHAVAENAGSARVLLRAGFTLEGTQRERIFHQGAWRDIQLFGLLRRDWETRRRAGG